VQKSGTIGKICVMSYPFACFTQFLVDRNIYS